MSMNDYRAYVEFGYNDIYHHGIKGQRWGIRRYQNPDGSLTPAGEKRYGKKLEKLTNKAVKDMNNNRTNLYVKAYNNTANELRNNNFYDKFNTRWEEEFKKNGHMTKNGGFDDKTETYERYIEDYENIFSLLNDRNLARVEKEFLQNNKNFQQAYEFYKKYPVKKFEAQYGDARWKELEEDCNRYIKEFDDYYANRKER